MTTDRIEQLRPVRKPGGIVVWVEDDTIVEPQYVIKAAPEPAPTRDAWHVTGVLCDCGALLRDEHELCPACVLPWCLQQEIRGSWQQAERHNRETTRKVA